ncbi:hypothetical protein ERO13_D06G096850v2 [Gossypium hirsutum]|uniref:Uncharacterized protein n=3 Tax=Gossypium TaxID=3633 RepID=A0A5J5R232_GOSBA|nr:hypothetical protein ES319_D06G111800v1 [Gossypium barbadense]KAG4141806.1 hypothetical protein ERO13_D06G096850v2 [Gossypium hirsutum]KAG4141807.1 hypothetical protein ERO13_D06G096850v2 [Gossypium hirsutum]TYH66418.1 hypothetical protein ES332_D06G122100v1 [Gossypium tomentosum]TYI76975.1 hypothetical protein E1A91_D06G114100v1 [Gossypium mustelinum]
MISLNIYLHLQQQPIDCVLKSSISTRPPSSIIIATIVVIFCFSVSAILFLFYFFFFSFSRKPLISTRQ